MAEIFSEKYKTILKDPGCHSAHKLTIDCPDESSSTIILASDVTAAIDKLKRGRDFNNIQHQHLLHADYTTIRLIALQFSTYVRNGCIPLNMLKGKITPIIKNKLGDKSSSENYRPVMKSSILLKMLEYCLLDKIKSNINLRQEQYGFTEGN